MMRIIYKMVGGVMKGRVVMRKIWIQYNHIPSSQAALYPSLGVDQFTTSR